MTTRTKTDDQRYSVTSSIGGSWLAGSYEHLSASGQDKASSKRKPDHPPEPGLEKQGDSIQWASFVRNGTKTPMAYGEEHPYSITYLKTIQFPGTWTQTVYNDDGTVRDHVVIENPHQGGSPIYKTYDPDAELRLKCMDKLRVKLGGANFHAGVAAAEADDAFGMMYRRIRQIFNGLRAAKRLDMRGVARALGVSPRSRKPDKLTPEGVWLELQYGWLPLLADIKGGAEYLAHHFNVPHTFRVRVRASTGLCFEWTPGYHGGTAAARKQVVVILKEPPNVAQLAGMDDPYGIAWEKLPFSFIADWFFNFGGWLNARNLVGQLSATYVVTSSERITYFGRASGFPPGDPPNRTTSFTGLTSHQSFTSVRQVGDDFSLPLPRLKSPGEVFGDMTRCANAVGLIVSMFRR